MKLETDREGDGRGGKRLNMSSYLASKKKAEEQQKRTVGSETREVTEGIQYVG